MNLRTASVMAVVGLLVVFLWAILNTQAPPLPVPEFEPTPALDQETAAAKAKPISATHPKNQNRTAADTSNANSDPKLPTHALQLSVVHHANGQPMPQVQGYWYALPDWDQTELFAWMGIGVDREDLIRKQGQPFTTDQDGKADLQIPTGIIAIQARSEGLYAERILLDKSETEQVQLTLKPDANLRIFVHGVDGRPLDNFPLVLLLIHRDWTSGDLVARSDETGHANFYHLPNYFYRDLGPSKLVLRAAAPFLDPPFIPIDLHHLPPQTLDYPVGPFGSVVLKLLDHQGKPHLAESPSLVQAQTERNDFWDQLQGLSPQPEFGTARRVATNGQAFFRYIGIGMELEAGAQMDRSDRYYEVKFSGPQNSGEQVEATLWIEHLRPLVRFRLVDEEGLAIRNQSISCSTILTGAGFNRHGSAPMTTDSEGRTEFIVTDLVDHRVPGTLALELQLERDGIELQNVLQLPAELKPGAQDLGDVVLRQMPILLAGRIMDSRGKAVAQARLKVTHDEGPLLGAMVVKEYFASKADGSFEILGSSAANQVRLHVTHGSGISKQVVAAPGTQGLLVRLDPIYQIKGRLLLDEGILPTSLMVRTAWPPEVPRDPQLPDWMPQDRPSSTGEFEVAMSQAQPVSVLVTDRASGAILTKFEQVMPVDEGENGDPRLAQIDLRGQLWRFDLKFVDGKNLPVTEVEMTIPALFSPLNPESVSVYLWQGKNMVILPIKAFDFVAIGTDQRRLRSRVTSPGESTFQMETGLAAQVQVLPSGVLPEKGRIVLQCTPIDASASRFSLWENTVDSQGVFHFNFPSPGLYRASVDIYRLLADGKTTSQKFPPKQQGPVFEVLDSTGLQNFAIELDRLAIEAFLNG
jgi:hypothetical protein